MVTSRYLNTQKLEISFYFTIWTSSVLYAIYTFAKTSKIYFSNYDDKYNDFQISNNNNLWPKKDVVDTEWECILYLIRSLKYWYISHLFITESLKQLQLNKTILQIIHVLFASCFLQSSYGLVCTFLVFSQPLIFFLAGTLHRKSCIWICSLFCLIGITILKKENIIIDDILNDSNLNTYQINVIIVLFSWVNLRCTSFYLENKPDKFLACLAYCSYFPTLFTGPLILYPDFMTCYTPIKFSIRRTKQLIINIFRCTFWLIFTEVSLHYVYVNAAAYQPKLLESLNIWELCGFGYTMGQFFHLKYIVSYGFSTSIAAFENVTVPSLPRCIGRVHLYSDMWKYFDAGLYKFLVKFIYKPLSTKMFINNKLLPSCFCFLFVYVWHGVDNFILIWASLNYLGVTTEYLGDKLMKTLFKTGIFKQVHSTIIQKFKCIASAPLLCMSAISNFYFFGGTEVGTIFFKHLLTVSVINIILLWFVLYCCCQVSTELSKLNARKA